MGQKDRFASVVNVPNGNTRGLFSGPKSLLIVTCYFQRLISFLVHLPRIPPVSSSAYIEPDNTYCVSSPVDPRSFSDASRCWYMRTKQARDTEITENDDRTNFQVRCVLPMLQIPHSSKIASETWYGPQFCQE
jgi:hypothetical protein